MKVIEGNLLDFPSGINVLIHQANTERTMGAGIAKAIATRYPDAAYKDRVAHSWGHTKLGNFSYSKFPNEHKFIFNLYGQSIDKLSSAGIPTDYNAVILGFQKITKFLGTIPEPCTIGVPYNMGCALGGGNWEIYSSIIDNTIGKVYPVIAVKLV